jgi:F-type H+-transporting ATPase subunit b
VNGLVRRVLGLWFLAACLVVLARPVRASALQGEATTPENTAERRKENRELIYKTVNFLLLAGGLAYLLRKPLSEFFTVRSASIHKGLEEGRKALEASQAQLAAVEQKLRRLDEEIQAFRDSAAREMEAERERMHQATAEEAAKILESARAQIATAIKAAKLELKIYAAQEGLKLAEEMIRGRMDDSTRHQLVSRFMEGLARKES